MRLYIGIPTADGVRHAVFYDYVNQLHKPPNTISAGFHSNSPPSNRNAIIEDALYHGCTHILFLDDDMAFSAYSLDNLLKFDLDIVSGLYLNRGYPHTPVLFELDGDGRRVHYLQPHEHGLIEVGACGFGFLLVKTEVFYKLEKPFVRFAEFEKDNRNEDVGFCMRARDAGFKVYCDLDTICGHMSMTTIWPTYTGTDWHTGLDTGGDEVFTVPQKTARVENIITPLSYTKEDDMYAHMLNLIDK